jgi:hypothetical protein
MRSFKIIALVLFIVLLAAIPVHAEIVYIVSRSVDAYSRAFCNDDFPAICENVELIDDPDSEQAPAFIVYFNSSAGSALWESPTLSADAVTVRSSAHSHSNQTSDMTEPAEGLTEFQANGTNYSSASVDDSICGDPFLCGEFYHSYTGEATSDSAYTLRFIVPCNGGADYTIQYHSQISGTAITESDDIGTIELKHLESDQVIFTASADETTDTNPYNSAGTLAPGSYELTLTQTAHAYRNNQCSYSDLCGTQTITQQWDLSFTIEEAMGSFCPGDLDGDGDCDGEDLAIFALDFGSPSCP